MFAELRERVMQVVEGLVARTTRGQGGRRDRTSAEGIASLGGLVSLATPKAAEGQSKAVQVVLAGGTLAALGVLGGVAAMALGWLVAALAAIYFLLTQVLGLNLEVDPRHFGREPFTPA